MHNSFPMESFLPAETVAMLKKYGENLPDDFALEEQMTILFSDMRGFTELAESYGAHEVYAFKQKLLPNMVAVLINFWVMVYWHAFQAKNGANKLCYVWLN
ncbi:MAG: hypothetical protein Q9M18_03910 [Mariprofundaceae bacterium]|nr:hypothetical protein [Mariprofundaceae bacterium]